MLTYRWERRLFGAVVSGLLCMISGMFFEAYSHKPWPYFIYGTLTFMFCLAAVCLCVSGFYYLIFKKNLAPKKLWR